MASNPSFNDRVMKSAELLSVEKKSLIEDLKKNGIDNDSTGVSLLDTSTTTIDDLVDIIEEGCGHGIPKLKLKAAASILKGNVLAVTPPKPASNMPVMSMEAVPVTEIIKSLRPIEQQNDRELLERYSVDRESSVEQELNKRARQQNFIVLKPGKFEPGKEEIDIDLSLDLLKTARKRTNPSMIPVGDKVFPVYRITEMNIDDRIMEICPFCGESLYRGYCEKCHVNFAGIGDDERAYMSLIVESDNFDLKSFSDKKAVIASGTKGIEDLKQTWPSIVHEFEERKATNDLPRIKIIATRPSQADPFFQNGNRAFGNRAF